MSRRRHVLENAMLVALLGLTGRVAGADAVDAPPARTADVAPLTLPPRWRLDLPAVLRPAGDADRAVGLPVFGHALTERLSLDGGIDLAPGARARVPCARLGLSAAPADRLALSATMTSFPLGMSEPMGTGGETPSQDAVPERMRAALGGPFRVSPSDRQLDLSASWTPAGSLDLDLAYAAVVGRIPGGGSLHVQHLGGTLGWSIADRVALSLGAGVQDLRGTAVGAALRVWGVTASGTVILGGDLGAVVAVTRDSLSEVTLLVGLQYRGD